MLIHFEDSHYIVASKPPKIASQADTSGDLDFCTLLETFINQRDQSDEQISSRINTNIFVVHRLDRPVGGLIVYAKSKEAARKFSNLIQSHSMDKIYMCVACGEPEVNEGTFLHYLKKKSGQNVSIAVHKNNEGSKKASLKYKTFQKEKVKRDTFTLLEITLETGRHHQIRVQLSTEGLPLWGDAKYNPATKRKRNWTQIALWSHKMTFVHPYSGTELSFIDWPPEAEPWTLFEYFKNHK